MTRPPIAIQTRSLRQPLKQALHTAGRLKADGVEIDVRYELPVAELSQTGVRQVRKILDDLNLRVSAVAFPTRRGYDVAEELDRRVLATQAAMKFAHQLGTNVVINRVGHVPEDTSDEQFDRLVDVLSGLGAYGQRVGARLAAQTGNEDPKRLAQLLQALPQQSIGVDLHPSSLIANGHSPEEAVAELGPYIAHLHACDAVRDLAAGRAVEVELGRGTADLPTLLGRLEEFNYRGWVTIERRDSNDPTGDIEDAVTYLRTLADGG